MAHLDRSNYLPFHNEYKMYSVRMQRENKQTSEMEDFEVRIIQNEDGGFRIDVVGEGLGTDLDFDEDLDLIKVHDEEGYWETT